MKMQSMEKHLKYKSAKYSSDWIDLLICESTSTYSQCSIHTCVFRAHLFLAATLTIDTLADARVYSVLIYYTI